MSDNILNDLPIGFMSEILSNESALTYYSNLDYKTKEDIQNYIENSETSKESMKKIDYTVRCLSDKSLEFLMKDMENK